MMTNKGFKLNPDINEDLDYFHVNTAIFTQSVIYRGLLNFFLFLNALYQLRMLIHNGHNSLWGIALAVNSVLVCTLNLQAYVWAVVFCVLMLPYLIYLLLDKVFMCLCPTCIELRPAERKADGTRKIKKGTYLYSCLVFVWKRVNF